MNMHWTTSQSVFIYLTMVIFQGRTQGGARGQFPPRPVEVGEPHPPLELRAVTLLKSESEE